MKNRSLETAVIGGGIHGVASAIALAKEGASVTLIEKGDKLFRGTSGATQNRAHLGYHYPRSIETARECKKGLESFQTRYPAGIVYPNGSYYMIDAEHSKTSEKEFRTFCDTLDIPYEMEMPDNGFVRPESIGASFKVPEPVFDLGRLSHLFGEEAVDLDVRFRMNSEVVGADRVEGQYKMVTSGMRGEEVLSADVVLNTTYSHANNVMRVFGIEKDMTRYRLQRTEVVVAESDEKIPALTIMDGAFVSVLPYGHDQSRVLVYDVTHSVLDEDDAFLFDDTRTHSTNFKKMVEHGSKYYPFMDKLRYAGSLYGARPIPKTAIGDSRRTRIVHHDEAPGVFSILEGKFISALHVADELVEKMRSDGVL